MSDLLKKALKAERPAQTKASEWPKDLVLDGYPYVLAFLTTSMVDGKRRQTATLTVMVDQGMAKVSFKDRERGKIAWSSHETFTGALCQLEEWLAEGTCEWQEDRFAQKDKRK